MRRLSLIFVFLLTLFSCTKEEDNTQLYLNTLEDAFVSFDFNGGAKEIKFYSSAEWRIYGQNDWCTVSQESGNAGNVSLNIVVSPNIQGIKSLGNPERVTLLEIKAGGMSLDIEVKQEEEKFCIIPSKKDYDVSCAAQTLEINIVTNSDNLIVEMLDDVEWCKCQVTVQSETERLIVFQIDANTVLQERECKAIVKFERGEMVYTIKQEANLDLPINFADKIVKTICVGRYDSNNDGELSYREASRVKTIEGEFFNTEYKKVVKTFDEFQYFTSVTYIPYECFAYTSLKSIVLPNSVISLGALSFAYSLELESISLGENLESIGQHSFSGCVKLKTLELPSTLTTISNAAFQMLESLETITIPSGVKVLSDGLLAASAIKSVTLPSTLQKIGDGVFSGCANLEKLIIPKSVKEIGNGIVVGCNNLSSFDGAYATDDGKYLIKDGIVKGCALKDVTSCYVPDGVLSIGESVFSKTENLEYVTIPSSVLSIGNYAFAWAVGLKSLKVEAIEPPVMGVDVFCENKDEKVPISEICVPSKSVSLYKNADGWSKYQSIIVGY